MNESGRCDGRLRILHVLRSPVGGLFRHVADLVRGQSARGHEVGMVCDSLTGGDYAAGLLRDLTPHLSLGLSRFPMTRHIGPGDLAAIRQVARCVTDVTPDIVHGHGGKGGAFARLAAPMGGSLRVYTPHGGSLLFQPGDAIGRFYLTLEQLLNGRTDLFLFESAFVERLYREKVGEPKALWRVVPNGVGADEFAEVPLCEDATDILCIGELRALKGVDLLLGGMGAMRQRGRALSATIVGAGPARDELQQLAREVGVADAVRFLPPTPARKAFALGRVMVVPSRAESFPYIVLEALAAGKPLIATRVGGIPDIFGPYADRLIPPNDQAAIERALADAVNDLQTMQATAALLRERVRINFCLDDMVEGGIEAYRAALAERQMLKCA